LKKTFLVAGILFHFLTGHGQHRIGDFLAYGHDNGLPVSLYYSVLQSSDGYLWMGSSSGLVRFDGKNYKIFFSDYTDTNSLSDNIISDMIEDDDQNLWIAGVFQGLSKLNLHTGHIKRYSRLSQDNTPGYGIKALEKDHDGQIWAATSGRGLAHYLPDQDSFEFFIPNPLKPHDGSDYYANHVSGIVTDPSDKNIFWISCFDGLYKFNKEQKTFDHFTTPTPEIPEQPLSFLCVEADRSHILWLGTWYFGLVSFNLNTHQFDSYRYSKADPPNSSHYVVLDVQSIDDSTLYLASRNEGLLSFNKRTKEIHPLLTNDQLPDGSSDIDIQNISVTPDAGVFVGGNYYIYHQHNSFNRFGNSVYFPYGLHFSVQQIKYDRFRKGYWMGFFNAGEMLFYTEDMGVRKPYHIDNQTEFQCNDIAIDRNQRVWAVSPVSGLLILNEEKNLFEKAVNEFAELDGIAGQITLIESDDDGNLWLLTNKEIYYFDVTTNGIREFDFLSDSNSTLHQLSLCSGQNQDAWIGSDQGLFHCMRDQNKVIRFMPDDTTHTGIANAFIKTMTIDQSGNAWIGFESDGVQVISGSDHSIVATYNLDDGLPGMQINFMATDSAGRIWVGTSAGLALFNPNSEAGIWQLFNREDGIKRDFIDRPIMATEDGKLFFNINEGVSWIDIEAEQVMSDQKPLLHLISFNVDGKPYDEDLLPDYLTSVELSYASKEIKIEYAAMDWLHPGRTKYFYRIEGISHAGEWIENNQANILLTGMKPGKYILQLYAVNGDGLKSKEISLPIFIRPPFWQRWWFISLVVLGIFLLGYVIYQYRIGQFKKLQNMRNTISTNLHDDIGASLSNIHILTTLTQRNISNTANATSYITKAGDEIQRISESLSDIVWNISPRYDDLDNLFIRMKRYAADMFDGKNIAADLIFPNGSNRLTMPMDQRRDFYLIFKEAVNNLVKYADATEASVKVTTDHHVIRMEVSDDGKGFDERTLPTGNGMQNMKQRAEKWKALLKVHSEPGKGTRILLEMKVN